MRYGIPYKGRKSKYAEQILSYIPSADNFYDLFCGGGAITHCALLQNRWKNYIMNDIDKGLSQLFVDAVNGKYKNEKRWISREEFFKLKDTDAYVRYIWSFANNGRDYMFSREIEETKRLGHNAIVFGDIKPLEKLLNTDLSFLLKIDDLSERRKTLNRYIKKISGNRFELQQLQQEMTMGLESRRNAMKRMGKENIDELTAEIDEDMKKNPCIYGHLDPNDPMHMAQNAQINSGMLNGQTTVEQVRTEMTGQNGGAEI